MSRYDTQLTENLSLVIGWDPPLLTYFGQVHDHTQPEDEQIIRWVGTSPRELYEINDLIRALTDVHRDIAPFIREHELALYADKDEGR